MLKRAVLDRQGIEAALAESLAAVRASADLQPAAALVVLRQVQGDCENVLRSLERLLMRLEAAAPEL